MKITHPQAPGSIDRHRLRMIHASAGLPIQQHGPSTRDLADAAAEVVRHPHIAALIHCDATGSITTTDLRYLGAVSRDTRNCTGALICHPRIVTRIDGDRHR